MSNIEQSKPAEKSIYIDPEWKPIENAHQKSNIEFEALIRSMSFFRDIKNRDWKELRDLFHERRYQNGELVFEVGMPGLGMYIVVNGAVRIVEQHEDEEIEIGRLTSGDFFGEMSLVEDTVRSAAAVADGDVLLIGLFRPQLLDLMYRRPKFGLKLMERLASILAKRLRIANKQLAELSKKLRAQS